MEINDDGITACENNISDYAQVDGYSTVDANGNINIHDEETMMDVSLSLHDYCASPVVKSTRSGIRSSYVQTYLDCKIQEVQTDEIQVKVLVDASTQTEHLTENKEVQCRLPILAYQDIKINDDMVSFYTGIPDAKLFEAVFDEIKEEAEERNSRRQLNDMPEHGGNPRILSVLDEIFMVLMRLRL